MSRGAVAWWRLAAVAATAVLSLAGHAQGGLRAPPEHARTVSDEVGVLSPDEHRRLADILEGILAEDGVRVVVLVVPSVQPEPIEDFVERVSRHWTLLGALDGTRTVFMVVAVDDREMVVMPGRGLGLEAVLARPQMTEGIAPLFRQRRYYEALLALAERVHIAIHERATAKPGPKR